MGLTIAAANCAMHLNKPEQTRSLTELLASVPYAGLSSKHMAVLAQTNFGLKPELG